MAPTHSNPLHAAIQSKSAQQWSRALSSGSPDNVLQVCQDPQIWKQLPTFKSFLFARHVLSISRLNSDFMDAFVRNVPQLGKYISQLDSESVFIKDIYQIVEFLFGWKRFESVSILLNSCADTVRQGMINKILHLKRIDALSREKDPRFFQRLEIDLPEVWAALQYQCILNLSGFTVIQRCPHLLTAGEYREDNDQFLDHIASGHHKIYIQTSPNLFLTFLIDNNMLEDPRIFNKQLRQIKIRVWVILMAHLHSMGFLDLNSLSSLLTETFSHIDYIGCSNMVALQEAVAQIEFRNKLRGHLAELGANELDTRKI